MRFIEKRSCAQRMPRTHRMSANYLVKTKHSENVIVEEKDDFVQPVDVVIEYMDGSDEEWLKLYNKFSNKPIDVERYHECGTLRYVLRSIEKYIPFVNNVFLVVKMNSQIPEWINHETVIIVKEEEFIPNEYLPTFNSICIEQFIHFIPNLSEYYIEFCDDYIINNKILFKDIFDIEKPRYSFHMVRCDTSELYRKQINRAYEYVFDVKLNGYCAFPFHNIRPKTKKTSESIFLENKEIILNKNTTKFREEENTPLQYYYGLKKHIYSNMKLNDNYTVCHNDNDYNNIKNILNSNQKLICINSINEEYEDKIIDLLENKFSEKSKYEN